MSLPQIYFVCQHGSFSDKQVPARPQGSHTRIPATFRLTALIARGLLSSTEHLTLQAGTVERKGGQEDGGDDRGGSVSETRCGKTQ